MHFHCRRLTAVAALCLLAGAEAGVAMASNPTVRTEDGKVQGVYTAHHQVRAFAAIPYAAPPVGDLRWKPPQPVAKWFGTLSATHLGHRCIQTSTYPDMIFADPGPSEDCLTLNVWTPTHAARGSLPVMVWIFGGGFVAGGSSRPHLDGQFLAHRNVVVVTLNYRLGIFGFLALPELAAESPHHASGNYGLLDQAAALAWVHRNISAFGGDPNNITIFGESAGSFSVSSLMASPLTRSLIAKAIGESGAAFYSKSLPYPPRDEAERQDAAFIRADFPTTILPNHTISLAALRKVSVAALVKAATTRTNPRPPFFSPDVDGYFLPQSVPEIYAAGQQAHVPLLAGWNSDEVRSEVIMNPVKPTVASFTALATKDFGDRAQQFLSVYPAATNAEAIRSEGDFDSDLFIAYSTWAWLEAQVKTGRAPVYRYRFDRGSPGDKFHPPGIGAFHSDEIEYVFGTLDFRQEAHWRPEDRALSNLVQQYWTNFARNGNPNAPNLPVWPTYGPENGWQVMHLNATSEAKPDTQRDRYLFLNSVWADAK